ncbi:hypothetical protein EDC90_100464 [Martelella mediterranea]|uniref:Uncharacterized protein n=1 Tax=Martelella mediterranea TaxID=293089 RepID=A0A4R3NWM6_9HYPH|nr:hypothetical protein EDC90_100464 [Martelella mediterranea]
MRAARITKVICPECGGQGYLSERKLRCAMCCGNGRVSVCDARQHAISCRKAADRLGPGTLYRARRQRLYQVAEWVFETIGELPPWRRHREAEG